ncbi:hypothetical protein JCM10207_006656 [Rhodosporidiobolus poonsookiae]
MAFRSSSSDPSGGTVGVEGWQRGIAGRPHDHSTPSWAPSWLHKAAQYLRPGRFLPRSSLLLIGHVNSPTAAGAMLGSPPPAFPSLDDLSHRAGESDFLPAWSRTLSNSPKLQPTDGNIGRSGSPGAFLRVEDAMQGVEATRPDVGLGLSPVLGPILDADSPAPLEQQGRKQSLGTPGGEGGGSFDSAFKKFQPSPSQDRGRPSPVTRSLSFDSPAPLSTANVAALPSMSPVLPPHSAASPRASMRSPSLATLKAEVPMSMSNFAEGLPEGLERRATGVAEADEGRIQAYAKLEFPSFDIYIQKLSVIIGRRPATSAPVPPSPAMSLGGMQLADYILGLPVPPIIKQDVAALLDTSLPASLKGKEKAVDGTFEDFLRSSPPPASTAPAIDPSSPAATPSVPPAEPFASTSALPLSPTIPSAIQPTLPMPAIEAIPLAAPITDVDLGPIRAISRQHARLFFDYDSGAWVLEVLGRNGVVVEGKWRAKGQRVVLTKKTRIQIAERIFYFVLPALDPAEAELEAAAQAAAAATAEQRRKGKVKATVSEISENEAVGSSVPSQTSLANAALHPSVSLPSLPPLPGLAPSASPAPPSSSASVCPSASPAPSSSLALPHGPSTRSTKVTRASSKPKPHPPPSRSRPPAAAVYAEPDEETLELGRQRAAMIAQILSGQVSSSASKSALVKAAAAAAIAQRKAGGKGKSAVGPPPGKGLGKGKGLPPRPRRPSNASWDENEVEEEEEEEVESSSSSSSSGSDSDDDDDDALDLALLGGSMAGGKKFVKRPESAQPSVSPAPAGEESPYAPRKTPAKHPRRRESVSAYVPKKTPVASASPAPPPAGLDNLPALPGLPALPSLPAAALPPLAPAPPSQATPSPALSASATSLSVPTPLLPASSLPPLPPFVNATSASPALSAASLPAQSSVAAAPPPAKKPKAAKKAAIKAEAGTTAAPPAASTAAPAGSAAGAAAAPAKPRPSPYTPAALPAGKSLPDGAPADNPFAKPPYTYASLIAQAVQSSEAKKLTMHEVQEWIVGRWPYFKDNQNGWQNSIRHNLTPARGFLKVVRRADEPGKGSFWQIDPSQLSNFDGHHFRYKKVDVPPSTSASAAAKPTPASPAPGAAASPVKAASTPAPGAARSAASPAPSSASAANPQLAKPLPIVICPIPDSYVHTPRPPDNGQPPDELTATLLRDPPIVMHEGKLILNPTIFASLPAERLEALQKAPAQTALQALQAYVVQHFKDKMRKAALEKAALEKAAGAKGAKAGAAPSAPVGKAPKPAAATKAPKVATKAPRTAATKAPRGGKAPRAVAGAGAAVGVPAATKPPSPAKSGTAKRGRDVDIDLTGPPAKVARTTGRKK